jgi:hypothetical protein
MTTKREHTTRAAARPRRTLAQGLIVAQRGALTRINTLTRQLVERLNYQNDPATQRFWRGLSWPTGRQFEGCTRRRQRECFDLIASLPEPFDQQLQTITKAILKAADCDSFSLLEQQAEVIIECRASLRQAALHLRQTGKATVRTAPVITAKVKHSSSIFHKPWMWSWPKLPGALEYG